MQATTSATINFFSDEEQCRAFGHEPLVMNGQPYAPVRDQGYVDGVLTNVVLRVCTTCKSVYAELETV